MARGMNTSGVANIVYLPAGTYTVEEKSAPTGYAKEAVVKVDKLGKALVAYLPIGSYDLVETAVLFGFHHE
jgi:hypothetical protein